MIKITDNVLLDKYINNTGISKLFSQDINNYLELFSLNKGDFLINEGECSNYLYFLVMFLLSSLPYLPPINYIVTYYHIIYILYNNL